MTIKHKKVIQSQKISKKCPNNSKNFSLKIHKGAGIYKKNKRFPNKGT